MPVMFTIYDIFKKHSAIIVKLKGINLYIIIYCKNSKKKKILPDDL